MHTLRLTPLAVLLMTITISALSEPAPQMLSEPEQILKEKDVPEWFKDSERLSQMLSGKAIGKVQGARVIRRLPTPIEGIDALILEGQVKPEDGELHTETFVIYVDHSGRYLIAGLLIDMQTHQNVGQIIHQTVRAEHADNPALALNPLDLHTINAENALKHDQRIVVVIDLGPEKGRRNLKQIAGLYASLAEDNMNHQLRSLQIALVSAAHDELSTAAMAMAFGYDAKQPGSGYEKLLAFANEGDKTPWLQPNRLLHESALKEIMGLGVFKLENNSTQALIAKIDTLPLVYLIQHGVAKHVPTPTSVEDWKILLMREKTDEL